MQEAFSSDFCSGSSSPRQSPRTNQLYSFLRAFAPPFYLVCLLVLMNQLSGRSTNNSAAAMLDSSATSSAGSSSSVASSVVSSALVTTSPTFVMTTQGLSQAFSRALGDSLPQILAAVQNQTSQLTASNVTTSGIVTSSTCSSSFHINSLPGFAAGLSSGNIVVPSFVSTYCTLGNLFLSHPSLCGSHGVSSGAASRHQPVLLSSFFSTHLGSLGRFFATQAFCRWPRIFTHPGEAGYKNKGRAIRRSGGPATRKRQGPGFLTPNVLGWETARVHQEEGTRDYRCCNMGGSLYCVYVDLLLYSPI